MKILGGGILAYFCISLTNFAAENQAPPSVESAFSLYDARLQSKVWAQNIPALSIAVLWQGRVLWQRSYSAEANAKKINGDSVFRIGSITKPFTATAIMQLRDAKKLNLDDTLRTYLPAPEQAALFDVSLRQLLTHTSGWPREVWYDDRSGTDVFPNKKAFLEALERTKLRSVPGAEWYYSNAAYAALGLVVEKVSGMSFENYVQKNIFTPLQMHASSVSPKAQTLLSGYDLTGPGKDRQKAPFVDMAVLPAAGGIASSVNDLARFAQLYFGNGGDSVLSPNSAKEMHELQWKNAESDSGWGYGWGVARGGKLMQHEGSVPGFTSVMSLRPDESYGVIALCNTTDSNCADVVMMAFTSILPSLRALQSNSNDASATTPNTVRLGIFNASDGSSFILFKRDEQLFIVDPADNDGWKNRVNLNSVAPNQFIMDGGESSGERLTFVYDNTGQIAQLRMPGYSLQRQRDLSLR